MGDGPCEIAAIVRQNHGDLDGALRWFDRFAGRLGPARIREVRSSGGREGERDPNPIPPGAPPAPSVS